MIKKILKYILPYGFVHYYIQKKEKERVALSKHCAEKSHPHWRSPVRSHDECIVMAGGPSINDQWNDLAHYAQCADLFTTNYALQNPAVRALKPCGHALMDWGFFLPEKGNEQQKKVTQKMFAEIDWPITLYIPDIYYEQAKLYAYDSNPQIQLVAAPVQQPPHGMREEEQYMLMDAGKYGAGCMNVPLMLLYLSVVAGYKKVWLAGQDGGPLKGLSVDTHNRVLVSYKHFYDDTISTFQYRSTMADILYGCYLSYAEYELVQRYAVSRNVQIVNLSLESLLDVFPKGLLGAEPFESLRVFPSDDSRNMPVTV